MVPDAAVRFLLGDNSPVVLEDVRAAWLRWAGQDGGARLVGLHRYLGTGGPMATRLALRDALLTEAAALLPGPGDWDRARQLFESARTYLARRHDTWNRHGVPACAAPVDVLIRRAMAFQDLPETPEGFFSVLSE